MKKNPEFAGNPFCLFVCGLFFFGGGAKWLLGKFEKWDSDGKERPHEIKGCLYCFSQYPSAFRSSVLPMKNVPQKTGDSIVIFSAKR